MQHRLTALIVRMGLALKRTASRRMSVVPMAFLMCVLAPIAASATAISYYVMTPEVPGAALSVSSLEPGNVITAGLTSLKLDQYQSGTIPASELVPGLKISGTKFFSVESSTNAQARLVPSTYAGTAFAIPHIAGQHTYYILSPSAAATVTITLGANVYTVNAAAGVVSTFDAGSDNTIAGRISSTASILVAHVAYVSSVAQSAYAVPPTATDIVGIRSQNVVVAGTTSGTTVTVNASGGTSGTFSVGVGQKVTITTGTGTTQGQGSALHITANFPIAAVQYDDGDGSSMTSFQNSSFFGKRFVLPINSQYLAIGCLQASTAVTLYKGNATPVSSTCAGSATTPGKVFLGSATNGNNLNAGWYVIANKTIFATYEAAASDTERNLLGWSNAAGPAVPTLTAPASPTSSNPIVVSGTAVASSTVRLYVNGRWQASTTATSGGAYTFNAELADGVNQLYTTDVNASSVESDPSTVRAVTYNNTVPRLQSGTISTNTVWTPGSTPTPYSITGNLTVAAGAKLVLQAGTVLQFVNGVSLTVNGTIKVAGTPTAPVTLTSASATPTRGNWPGITITAGSTGSVIDNAVVQWAAVAVNLNNASAVIQNSTIKDFNQNGVRFESALSGSELRTTLVDNTNQSGGCVYIQDSSPLLVANTIRNCYAAVYIYHSSNPTINGGNDISGSYYGIETDGASSANPLPVINGNRITGSLYNSFYAFNYAVGLTTVINATGNWWGSGEPYTIASGINDFTDNDTSTTTPVVNYANYLTAATGPAVSGTFLNGPLTATTTTLTAGTIYDVLGSLVVPTGKTLVIPSGVTLRVHPANGKIRVDGKLTVTGAVGSVVTFTSGRAAPSKGSWLGIIFSTSATASVIDTAVIDWATTGVEIDNAAVASVKNSTIRNFSSIGVLLQTNSATNDIRANLIDGVSGVGTCLNLQSSSPTIVGNTIRNCYTGIYVYQSSSPTINGGNIVTANYQNVALDGANSANPQPIVNGNQIFGSLYVNNNFTTTNYLGGSSIVVNAQQNWWGSNAPTAISTGIYDATQCPQCNGATYPVVDYGNFLNAAGGTPVAGNYLNGPLTAVSTTLTAGLTYDVLGTIVVPAGKTLTIPAGTILKFDSTAAALYVQGTLITQGVSGNQVVLTSGAPSPVRGGWKGVLLQGSAAGVVVDGALVEWAYTGVEINNGATATIKNNTIRNFAAYGISAVNNTAVNDIHGNLIDGVVGSSSCVFLMSSSPTMAGNTVRNCYTGIYIYQSSSPIINAGNIVTANYQNIYVDGATVSNPAPVINGNQIYGSIYSNNNFMTSNFLGGSSIVLNAQQNWWGTTQAFVIAQGIYDASDCPQCNGATYPLVDYSNFLAGPGGQPLPGNYLSGVLSATSTTLVAGTAYEILGNLIVPVGKSLTVPAGTTLRFNSSTSALVVQGSLQIQGSASSKVIFTSGQSTPTRGGWAGILIQGPSASVVVDGAQIDWAAVGVEINNASAIVRNSLIRNFSNTGIYANGATSGTQFTSNTIDNLNKQGTCLQTYNSSPLITGNTLTHCSNGLYLRLSSNPTVNAYNKITLNVNGIVLDGDNVSVVPHPVINANSVLSNSYNWQNNYFPSGSNTTVVNATGNWWGTAIPSVIADSIYDYTDQFPNSAAPVVDYSGYLSAANGTAVTGNFLNGELAAASTTLTAGASYEVLGTLHVAAGKTLTIPAGTTLRFHSKGSYLGVDGTLIVQGASGNLANLTAGAPSPTVTAWNGVWIRAGATGVNIDRAMIQWASTGLEVDNTSVILTNSTLQNFGAWGVRVLSGTAGSQITGNLIDGIRNNSTCLEANNSAPLITGNTIKRCYTGIHVYFASNPTINANNIITGNTIGISADGGGTNAPAPVVNGNQIFANLSSNFTTGYYPAASGVVINARANWWGSVEPSVISQSIYDTTDCVTCTDTAVVDYANFLDGPSGTQITGNYLNGPLTATTTTLTGGTMYDLLGTVTVPAGKVLVIPAGTTLRVHPSNGALNINGTLTVQGSSASPVMFTSGQTIPLRGAWQGILVNSAATAVTIDFAVIDWAQRGVYVLGSSAAIRDTVVRNFSYAGIDFTNATGGEIRRDVIDSLNTSQPAYGIRLENSSPVVASNRVQNTQNGIYLLGNSNPSISGNALVSNTYGIFLNGNGTATGNPNPVITGNDLFGNLVAQLYASAYGIGSAVINATANWWGTPTPVLGTQIQTSGSPAGLVNFSSPASGPLTSAAVGLFTVAQHYISPNADGVQDTTLMSGTLSSSASWSINVRNASNTVVRTFTGTGTAVSANWDGKNGSNVLVPDGLYRADLSITSAIPTTLVASDIVTVDTTLPVATVTSPAANAVLRNLISVPVVGSASDTNLKNFDVQFGVGASPTVWTNISPTQTVAINSQTLGTWIIGSTDGTTVLANGVYTIRVQSRDLAGNVRTTLVPVTIDNAAVLTVSRNKDLIHPLTGETVTVSFTIQAPGTAYLRFYPESGGALVREISQVYAAAGTYSLVWNGKDNAGIYVPDEAYKYTLTVSDGTRTTTYDLPTTGGNYISGTTAPSFDANKNVFYKSDVSMNLAGRIRMLVQDPQGQAFYPYSWVPFLAGTTSVVWDGRDALGNIEVGGMNMYFDVPKVLAPASVIVKGTQPTVSGAGTVPTVEVQSEPYYITHSFDESSTITYRIDQDSYVTVKLLPPNVGDPNDPAAIVLTNNQLQSALSGGQPADHAVQWLGYQATDTNNILTTEEGTYTFAIQATSVSSGQTSLYRGALQIHQ